MQRTQVRAPLGYYSAVSSRHSTEAEDSARALAPSKQSAQAHHPCIPEVTRRRMCTPSMGEFHCAALHRCRPSTTQGWTYSEISSMTPTRSTSGKVRSFLMAGIARPRRRTHDQAADPPLDPPHPHNRSGLTPSARRKARAHATAAVATAATAPHPVAVEPDPCTARATAAAVRNVGCHPGSRRTRRACERTTHTLSRRYISRGTF